MSFYVIGITGSVESTRRTARSWGVRLYGAEAIGNPDANDDARAVVARASLRYGKKLDRWYKQSGDRIKEIDAATPPEALAYLKSVSREERLSLEEKLFDATRNWQSGVLLFYQPVIDTPVRTYAWIAVKKLCGVALGLAIAKRSATSA
ncbi:MAG TPA: hypothetical protein VHT21_16395 [Stellaceae bacterium]|jgi:hypothetical protein|nr:hypothetical protein [Stellaceae bacterium]